MTIRVPDIMQKDICLEYLNGMTVKDLAKMFGYSPYLIKKAVKDAGLPTRKKGGVRYVDEWNYYEIYDLFSHGKTVSDICEIKDLTPLHITTVLNVVSKNQYKYEMMQTLVNQYRSR